VTFVSSKELAAERRIIVLSPHLDDAVLSCGGLVATAVMLDVPVTVVSIFTAPPSRLPPPPLACWFHTRCGLADDAMHTRKLEDHAALASLGAELRHLDLEECMYRRGPAGDPVYATEREVFAGTSAREPTLMAQLAERIRAIEEWGEADMVAAPLGIGGHVDHALTRDATLACRGSKSAADTRTYLLFEDVPYLLYRRCRGWQRRLPGNLRPSVLRLRSNAWAAKLDAIAAYSSQEQILWEDSNAWRADLSSYAAVLGAGLPAERYWLPG
jgi:LmbE family N-acetylglucosaminyl deacetylase